MRAEGGVGGTAAANVDFVGCREQAASHAMDETTAAVEGRADKTPGTVFLLAVTVPPLTSRMALRLYGVADGDRGDRVGLN